MITYYYKYIMINLIKNINWLILNTGDIYDEDIIYIDELLNAGELSENS